MCWMVSFDKYKVHSNRLSLTLHTGRGNSYGKRITWEAHCHRRVAENGRNQHADQKTRGVPVVRSLQGTVFLADKQVEPDLRRFVEEQADWVIFTTGIGTETLVDLAEKIGVKEPFLTTLRGAKIACRGYKTFATLKKWT